VILIVDANIIFSGILNTDGKIGDLLINSKDVFQFIAPYYLRREIRHHYPKLAKISDRSIAAIQEVEYHLCKDMTFIAEEQIADIAWEQAEGLVFDVDPKDIAYVAFSIHFGLKIWSGDKKLVAGLAKKGFTEFIDTESVYWLRNRLKFG